MGFGGRMVDSTGLKFAGGRIFCAPVLVRPAVLFETLWQVRPRGIQCRQLWPQRHAATNFKKKRYGLIRVDAAPGP